VVSTTRESKVEDVANGKRWTFPVSKILSPYNFSMHAGPYKVWEDATSAKYPMRLFARQSVADQVDPAPWFEYTRQGLAWFDDYFGIPYQYGKYDQLLCRTSCTARWKTPARLPSPNTPSCTRTR